MMLADSAQEVGGKLYILGGGWSIKGPQPSPMAIAIKIDVPWTETSRRHQFRITLVGEDGEQPQIIGEDGQPAAADIGFEGDLEVGRPPGVPHGTDIDAAMALNMAPIPLIPGRGYVWRLEINGVSDENWQRPFRVNSI